MKELFKDVSINGFYGKVLVLPNGEPKIYSSKTVAEMRAKRLGAKLIRIDRYLITK